jgi:hypothetical protein
LGVSKLRSAKQQNQWWFYLLDVEKRSFIILNASTVGDL